MEVGLATKHVDKECTQILKAPDIKVNGEMINSTVRAMKPGQKEQATREIISRVRKKVEVSTFGQTAPFTKVIGLTIKLTVTAFIFGLMAESTTDSGKIMICKDTAFIYMQMVCVTMDTIMRTKKTALEYTFGRMVAVMKVGGTRESNTVLVST